MESEEDRQCYRRWARACYVVYLFILTALLIGFSLYDRQTSRVAHNSLTAGIDLKAIPGSSQNASGDRSQHDF
jgi:hypothetical protein